MCHTQTFKFLLPCKYCCDGRIEFTKTAVYCEMLFWPLFFNPAMIPINIKIQHHIVTKMQLDVDVSPPAMRHCLEHVFSYTISLLVHTNIKVAGQTVHARERRQTAKWTLPSAVKIDKCNFADI